MRHVHDNVCAHSRADCCDTFEVNFPRIGTGSRDDHFRPMFVSKACHGVVVDPLIVAPDTVGDAVIELARKIECVTVRQVAAVGKIHA